MSGLVASLSSSSDTIVKFLPSNPPAALICSTANVAPLNNCGPLDASKSAHTPILMGSLGCGVGFWVGLAVGVNVVEGVSVVVGEVKVGVGDCVVEENGV